MSDIYCHPVCVHEKPKEHKPRTRAVSISSQSHTTVTLKIPESNRKKHRNLTNTTANQTENPFLKTCLSNHNLYLLLKPRASLKSLFAPLES